MSKPLFAIFSNKRSKNIFCLEKKKSSAKRKTSAHTVNAAVMQQYLYSKNVLYIEAVAYFRIFCSGFNFFLKNR